MVAEDITIEQVGERTGVNVMLAVSISISKESRSSNHGACPGRCPTSRPRKYSMCMINVESTWKSTLPHRGLDPHCLPAR